MKSHSVSLTILALLLGLPILLGLFSGCEKDNVLPPNHPPHVSVTGGPPQGGETYYYVTISWVGWDEDGVVKYFLYAIDDTTQWTEIRELEQTFLFTADSLRQGEEFGRWHTFWIKAVDNRGANSIPDYLTFDARTIAPKTTILSPRCDPEVELCLGVLPVPGTSVRVVWEGVDPDSRDPAKLPVAYQWRLLNLPDTSSNWSEPGPETEVVLQNLDGSYSFAVRAIDEAGAVEPLIRENYNMILFRTMPGYGIPRLCVSDGQSGYACFPSEGLIWTRQLSPNQSRTFSWEGDASMYGGTISGYRFGIDIQNLEDPSQWESDWSLSVTSATVMFPEPGVHYLYVEVMDGAGAVTLATVKLDVVPFVHDRAVLYVDDFFDLIPTDAVHDQFTGAILTRCLHYTDSVYVFNCWLPGPGGVPAEMPQMVQAPSLEELSRYRFVIWDTDATSNSFDGGLHKVISSGTLQVYLNMGGRLWIYGREIVRGSDASPLSFSYGTMPEAGSFAAEFLRISGVVNRPIVSTSNPGNGFRRALPNRGVADLLPTLEIDYSKGGTSTVYGMGKVEAVMTAMQEPNLSLRPDTLFFYGANLAESQYMNKACGLRFHDLYHGWKVVYLGFPMHYFFESTAESLATFVTDWMLGDAGASPRGVARR
jgi:hypothetical protein